MLTFNDVPEAITLLLQRTQSLETMVQKLTEIYTSTQPAELPISQKDLCKHLRISEQTAIRWKKRKKIPVLQNGTTVRYILSDVLKALAKT